MPESPSSSKKKSIFRNIGFKFAVLLSFVLIIAMGTTSFIIVQIQKNMLDSYLHEKAEMLGSFVALISPEAILNHDYSSLNDFMLEATKEKDVAFSILLDPHGNTMTNYLDWDSPIIRAAIPPDGSRNVATVMRSLEKKKQIKSLEFPITFEGTHLGKLVVGVNQERLIREVNTFRQQLFIGSFICITLLALFIFMIFRRNVLRPVVSLMSGSERVASGILGEPVEIYADDELGRLSVSFNQMMLNRKKAEDELMSLRNMLSDIINSMPSILISVDQNGIVTMWNHEAEKVTGTSRENAVSQELQSVFPELKGEIHKVTDAMHSRKTIEVKRMASQVDGVSRFEDITIFPLIAKDVTGAVIRVDDVTREVVAEKEKEQLETKLRQSQKMESIGTLAGGVAHDFNNILTPILGYAELIKYNSPEDSKVTGQIDEILQSAKRAQNLVKQILTFTRQASLERKPLDVRLILKESLKLLRSTVPSTIEIDTQISEECGFVVADPTEIHQVVLNLCTNAYHAMREHGGVLTIILKPVEITSEDDSSLKLPPGTYLNLEVSDTGHGIDPAVMERIFEPYYTTKGIGEGTGLGLAVTHGIVTKSGGRITAYSEPGRGTTFKVFLPQIREQILMEEADKDEPVSGGSERILLVDDEISIIKLEQLILEELGYQVTAFTDCVEALQSFIKHPDNYDLVVTDMTMPHLTGAELAQKIFEVRPEMPIILCTGFSEILDEKEAKTLGIKKYISKPIIRSQFTQAIRMVLDQDE